MQDSVVQQIKERLDIVEIISGYLKLQKTGINYRAVCPFHSEKKPSFFVSPARQSWRCFGCGLGGSVFDFMMEIEGIEFGDALKILAQRAGVELKPLRAEFKELKTERSRLYEIAELACRFFEKQLRESAKGREAKKYLLSRGLNEESIGKWRLGFSPQAWQGLSDFLVREGYQREEIVRAGLAVESEKGRAPYDRFRGRIIFPIFDLNSQVIGFGARVFESSSEKPTEEPVAKYINTPNTLLYDKSRVLYGLNFSKVDVRKSDFAILTEGYLDVILSHQAGFTNTVGVSGSTLTPWQLKILKRYTQRLFTAFDMDAAGERATKKGIDLAQSEDFEIKVISLPKEADPADVIKDNPERWRESIEEARDIVDFYFETALSRFDQTTPEGKKAISRVLLPKIKEIPSKILQAHWVQKLSGAIKVGEEAVWEEMKKIVKKREETPSLPAEPAGGTLGRAGVPQKTRKDILQERILTLVLRAPENLASVSEDSFPLFSPEIKVILSALSKGESDKKEKMEKVLEKLKKGQENIGQILDRVAFGAEIEEFEDPKIEIELCCRELKKIDLKEKLSALSGEISRAEKQGNEDSVKKLIERFNQISRELKTSV